MNEVPKDDGFSLLEALLALTITLFVMAMVAQTMADVTRVHRSQTDLAVSSSMASLALDDILDELGRAGQGLGEGPPSVLPRLVGGAVSGDRLTVWSNPDVKASVLRGPVGEPGVMVPADSPMAFERGDLVLVAEPSGIGEAAEVVEVNGTSMAFRSRESSDGAFARTFDPGRGARALGVREVRYFLGEPRSDGRRELVKDVTGVGQRVLSRDAVSLGFEYLDADDSAIALGTVESSSELASVRVTISYFPGDGSGVPRTLTSRSSLAPRSATVDFERRDLGFRLARVFHPIESPVAVASRIGEDWAVILASGQESQDPSYLYTFEMEKRFLSASADDVFFLDDVRSPVALAFGPERGPLAGSLFLAASGLRIGHLARVSPDEYGKLSRSSPVTAFEGTEAIAQAGGIAFGVDGALYVTSREKGSLFRFRFDSKQRPSRPEHLFRLTGTPGALAEGTDGQLYFLMNHQDRGSLWKMAFDETLEPLEPVEVGALPGTALALTRDPVDGDLFALLEQPSDFVVVQLGRRFLARREGEEPRPIFWLSEWVNDVDEGREESGSFSTSTVALFQQLPETGIEELDLLSFDGLGSLYLGSRERDVVLQFELDRPSGRYAVGVAAFVVDRGPDLAPEIRMHAWKKTALAGR
jgi:hypothetical protein